MSSATSASSTSTSWHAARDVILLRMPAFGLDGPWRDRSGFAQTTEQVSGIAWMTGEAGGEALVRSTIDPIAGIHGAYAVLAALEQRRRTGTGQLIELPMVEVAMNVAAEPIVTWSAYGTLLERQGDRGPVGSPQGVYACADHRPDHEQWVALSITTDDEWRALLKVLGDPDGSTVPEFATRAGRRARHDDVDAMLSSAFAGRGRDEVVAALLAAGVRAAPVWDQMIQDELPQLAERGFTQFLEHPIAGRVGHPGTGMRSPQFDVSYRAPAPTVGQHTIAVLRDKLGLDPDELAALAAGWRHRAGVSRQLTRRGPPPAGRAQTVRCRSGPGGSRPSTSVKPYSSARSRTATARPLQRCTSGSVASATTPRPVNRGDSAELTSRLAGRAAEPIATSIRSVRTNPGHSDTHRDTTRRELVRGVGGEAVEGALAHSVRDVPGVFLRPRRADVDDQPGTRADHRGRGEDAGDVGRAGADVDHVVPVRDRYLPEREPRGELVGDDERVVHEHVEAAVLGGHALEQRADRVVVAVVALRPRSRYPRARRSRGRSRRRCREAGGRPRRPSDRSRRRWRPRRRARARSPSRYRGSRR